MHKGMRNFDLIMLRNWLLINFVERTGNDPRFKRHNYHHLRKSKNQNFDQSTILNAYHSYEIKSNIVLLIFHKIFPEMNYSFRFI